MYNKQITSQYFEIIKQSGYKYSKDELGFYFDNGMKRFSIMKTGPTFMCYYNKNVDGNWILQQRSHSILEFSENLRWILSIIQKEI